MKKAIVSVLILVLIFSAIGCKSSGEKRMSKDPNIASFAVNPPTDEGYIYGIGSASLASVSQSLQTSDARARTDIAFKLDVEVRAMINDYQRTAGTVTNHAAGLEFVENVSQQLTRANLRGVEVVKREQTADGAYWALARMSKADAALAAAEILETEASRYAEFKAMEALKMMEYQLNKK